MVRYLLEERPEWELINLDLLTYAGNVSNLVEVMDHPRHRFVRGDICDGPLVTKLIEGADAVLNLAAESHVDRSIIESAPFLRTNVLGTHILLEAAREAGVSRFLQVSTDEVYGELPWKDPEFRSGRNDGFRENSPLDPRSPYSASKAAGDLLALSYHFTHEMDVVIARGSNNYGPRQHLEKLIPLMVTCALEGKALPVYGDGLNVRDWIHVGDFCRGILVTLEGGRAGEIYNFGGEAERTNLQVVRGILGLLDRPEDLITFVPDRPGHDRRYAMDFTKATKELGWVPSREFGDGLAETVSWYVENRGWWGSDP
jgi:dTDP-glucose 4,6-dehydratase